MREEEQRASVYHVEHDPSARRDQYLRALESVVEACEQVGGELMHAELSEPAHEDAVVAVEQQLGVKLPRAFRSLLIHVGARLRVKWRLPWQMAAPGHLRGITGGDWGWDLSELVALQQRHRTLLAATFSDAVEPHAALWHGIIPIQEVSNGDLVALDLSSSFAPIIYLRRTAGAGHGRIVGPNATEAFDRLAVLGFPGPEHWQWDMFLNDDRDGIVLTGDSAALWKRWFFGR